ncbi:sodium/hydrogen exchanger 3 [Necator americanus]|uniref:Sodium/hydrogen exchanger 3 n=1 Tax=Necator americanus TaxID=51031 RepID=W2SHE2_NECAM|nr:sodium/hydrogen exchanger 3 [Necator americanus]ETN69069.1 sodium/hydrogen exchanger 3 [Necator americanus]
MSTTNFFRLIVMMMFMVMTVMAKKDMTHLEMAAQRRAENIHRLDSIILLTYISVLVVIVLTSWLFKHYRFMFVHETGLTLFYGLLIGFVIRYFDIGLLQSQTLDVILKDRRMVDEPPDYLRLEVKPEGAPRVSFHYELMEGFYADKKKHNEQKIEQKSAFSPEIFFNIMLPPIIFNAGYSLKKRHFFRNIGSILVFVFIGTTVSCFVTGAMMYVFTKIFGMGFSFQELLFFGAVISATDPVTVISIFAEMNVEADLFALVFGESALNDAVAIVLSSTIDNFSAADEVGSHEIAFALGKFAYIFFGSLLLGSMLGCGNALITKMTAIAEHPLLESSLFILVSYISFLLGEVVGLTGKFVLSIRASLIAFSNTFLCICQLRLIIRIVSVLFCGISQAHYTYNNLSEESQHTTKQFFQMISFVLESFIFCYIGVSVFVANNQKWNIGFLIFALISITAARAMFVYPLSFLLNLRRRPRLPLSYQHMLVFAGLRGAMAFALADRNTATDNRQIICSTTAAIVMVTVFFNGGMTSWMIDHLGIKHGYANERSRGDTDASLPAGEADDLRFAGTPLTPSGSNPWDKAFLPRKWYNFDANFMKPLLTHATPSLEQTLPPICLPFARMFTSSKQATATNNLSNDSSPSTSVNVAEG